FDWCVSLAVHRSRPESLAFHARPRPIPAGWKEDKLERTWLSDLQEINPHVGWGVFGKRGKLGYAVATGDSIRVDNKFYPNSISMHPPSNSNSTVTYRLNRQYKLFKAWAALNDTDNWVPASAATFVVFGDGVCLWASIPIDQPKVMEACRINVEGVDNFELQVHCPGDHAAVRAVWLEPALYK